MGLFSRDEPDQIDIGTLRLKCHVCGNDTFWTRTAKLNTTVAEFLDLGWANQSADCYVCSKCGYVHWFLPQ